MGKGGPHAVSEIGKRSIFKICGRCFGDSLCYKREIVYERLRYSIFMTWIANSVDRKFPANLACDRSECIGSSARMGHKYQSCSSRLLFLIEIDYPIVHACPPRSDPTKRLQEKASQSRVPAEQAQGKSWERQASLRSFRRTQQAPCQRQSVPDASKEKTGWQSFGMRSEQRPHRLRPIPLHRRTISVWEK